MSRLETMDKKINQLVSQPRILKQTLYLDNPMPYQATGWLITLSAFPNDMMSRHIIVYRPFKPIYKELWNIQFSTFHLFPFFNWKIYINNTMATVSAALKSRVRRPALLEKVMKPEETLKFFKGGQ